MLEHPAVELHARRLARARRRVFERFASDRYSRPALFDLDRKLEAYLPERDGVFVEAGAFDGFLQSNTYYFERLKGWSGLLVEPVPELAEAARRERRRSRVIQAALVPPELQGTPVKLTVASLMTLVHGAQGSAEADREHALAGTRGGREPNYEIEVRGATLSALIDEAQLDEVDLLVLDVEGYEPEALAGLDLERHRPRFLLVEMLDAQRTRERIDRLIADRYEHVEQLSPHDHLYRRRSSPRALGSSPPN